MKRSSLILCLLGLAAGPLHAAGAGGPLAIVGAVRGRVDVATPRPKGTRRAIFGLSLGRGDRVTAARDAAATLLFHDGNVVQLGEGSSVTIGTRVEGSTRTEIAGEVFDQVSGFLTGGTREGGLVALSTMRSSDAGSTPLLVSPRRTSIMDSRPAFNWRRIEGATRYRVIVSSAEGELWQREAADTALAYPEGAPPLPPGSDVLWEVEARAESGVLGRESTSFHVASAREAEDVRTRLEKIQRSLGADTAAGVYLAGSCLATAGFYQDAISRFDALCRRVPDSPGPHEALGRAFARVGLVDGAAREYERALALSREP